MTNDMIQLEHLHKEYPNQKRPAVVDLSFNVPAGEIAVLVGPSGCGKTTTMRMINRMIEPTSGRIRLDGQDVTHRDADELRRQVGYVIQQVGLFPNMTIAENVATVPRMLKWGKSRTKSRVDEMIELVGLDPALYRNRYPKHLSGGQQQRIGVARALCADPPIMLMDEPFGAIDPISRERLQNEFLRLQAELRKTIVFVTHDVDEAIKMGDRIVILRADSDIAQYDTPENILAAPADDFVREFIGSGAAIRRLGLTALSPEHMVPWLVVGEDQPVFEARECLERSGERAALIVNDLRTPLRWVTAEDLERASSLKAAGTAVGVCVRTDASLADVLDELLRSQAPGVVVVDGEGRLAGVVDLGRVVRAAGSMHQGPTSGEPETAIPHASQDAAK